MNFAERHAQIDPSPLRELRRRRQMWASCPDVTGFTLKPDAQIVPLSTVDAAIAEIVRLRRALFYVCLGAFVLVPILAAKLILQLLAN
jgi:hypothetical protein